MIVLKTQKAIDLAEALEGLDEIYKIDETDVLTEQEEMSYVAAMEGFQHDALYRCLLTAITMCYSSAFSTQCTDVAGEALAKFIHVVVAGLPKEEGDVLNQAVSAYVCNTLLAKLKANTTAKPGDGSRRGSETGTKENSSSS